MWLWEAFSKKLITVLCALMCLVYICMLVCVKRSVMIWWLLDLALVRDGGHKYIMVVAPLPCRNLMRCSNLVTQCCWWEWDTMLSHGHVTAVNIKKSTAYVKSFFMSLLDFLLKEIRISQFSAACWTSICHTMSKGYSTVVKVQFLLCQL